MNQGLHSKLHHAVLDWMPDLHELQHSFQPPSRWPLEMDSEQGLESKELMYLASYLGILQLLCGSF